MGGILACLAGLAGARAMSCFSEIKFGWCEFNGVDPSQPPSCPDYIFSIAGFQRKLESHYSAHMRPPLLEAFFLHRLHDEYKNGLVEADCPNPLIMAALPGLRSLSTCGRG